MSYCFLVVKNSLNIIIIIINDNKIIIIIRHKTVKYIDAHARKRKSGGFNMYVFVSVFSGVSVSQI